MNNCNCGVYLIRNEKNGKVYVGSSREIENRWNRHKLRLRRGTHGNEHLSGAWNKYGEDSFSFSILEVVDNPEELFLVEQRYIDKFDSMNRKHGYNKTKAQPGLFFS